MQEFFFFLGGRCEGLMMHTCRYIEQKMEIRIFLLKNRMNLELGLEEIQISLREYRSI